MSFRTIDEEELRQAAEAFGIDVAPNVPAESIADMLDAEGATYGRWVEMKKFAGLDEEEVVEVVEPVVEEKVVAVKKTTTVRKKDKTPVVDDVLVKMERKNQRFEAFGKVFTAQHPYVICDVETANRIFSTFDGFRTAHPTEAQTYYS